MTKIVPSNVKTLLRIHAGGTREPTTFPTDASQVSALVNAAKIFPILLRRSVPIAD